MKESTLGKSRLHVSCVAGVLAPRKILPDMRESTLERSLTFVSCVVSVLALETP